MHCICGYQTRVFKIAIFSSSYFIFVIVSLHIFKNQEFIFTSLRSNEFIKFNGGFHWLNEGIIKTFMTRWTHQLDWDVVDLGRSLFQTVDKEEVLLDMVTFDGFFYFVFGLGKTIEFLVRQLKLLGQDLHILCTSIWRVHLN